MPEQRNILDLPAELTAGQEYLETLHLSGGVRIERIISIGHATAEGEWYDQDWGEWVVLLRGQAILSFDDDTRLALREGEWVYLREHCRHRVEMTSESPPCIWLAVHIRTPQEGT